MKKTLLSSSIPVRKGSSTKMFNQHGEVNASSKKDLVEAIANLVDIAQTRNIMTEETAATKEKSRQANRAMLTAAMNSREELAALGETIATNLIQTGNRMGFARNLLTYQELGQGEIAQFRMTVKNVMASLAVGPVKTETQLVRDRVLFPQEFYITARPYIEQRDLASTTVDLLEQKYDEGMENIIVVEDRTWKQAVDNLAGVSNPNYTIAGAFTPQILSRMVTDLSNWNLSARTTIMSTNLLSDLMSDPSWQGVLDPVSQQELLLTGRLGTIYGTSIVTDAFRPEAQRVLNNGELYVVSDPDQHGGYTDRGGVESTPIDVTTEKVPGAGWVLTESFSLVVANARSFVKATRIGR